MEKQIIITETYDKRAIELSFNPTFKSGKFWLTVRKPKAFGYDVNYTFRTEEREKEYLAEWKANREARKTATAQRRKEEAAYIPSSTVGTIFSSSWGYDQTNVDFYMIIEMKDKTAKAVRIPSKRVSEDATIPVSPMRVNAMTGDVYVDTSMFVGEPFTCRVKDAWNGKERIKVDPGGLATTWNGKAAYETPFGMGH